jgi:hypothetical protein
MTAARRRAGALATLAAVGLSAAGCGSDDSSTSAEASPQAILRCLNAHKLGAELTKPGHRANIAALHEIRIPLGEAGDLGDGFVEFLDSPEFAKKVAGTAISNFHYVAGARGKVAYEYSKSTPRPTGTVIRACAFQPA